MSHPDPKPTNSPHFKRALRDRLANLDANVPIRLLGPRGVGKRTLASRLPDLSIETSERRHNPLDQSLRPTHPSIRVHPLLVHEIGIQSPDQFERFLIQGGFPGADWQIQPESHQAILPTHLIDTLDAAAPRSQDPLVTHTWLKALYDSVGQPLSVHRLAGRLSITDQSLRQWLAQLESHFGLFQLAPLQSPTGRASFRALKKNTKAYPYAWHLCPNRHSRLEALIANHLLAWIENQSDLGGDLMALNYFRDCDQREVDFVVLKNQTPILMVQCDSQTHHPNKHLSYLHRKYPNAQAWHVSLDGPIEPRLFGNVQTAHPLALLWGLA